MKKLLEKLKTHKKKSVVIIFAIALYLAALGLGVEVDLQSLVDLDLSALGEAIEGVE